MKVLVLASATLSLLASASTTCKVTPRDAAWPSQAEWNWLNDTLGGALFQTVPAASACYPGNPFGSKHSCTDVTRDWSLSTFQASLPEGIDYPAYANYSCVPPGLAGYPDNPTCSIGGLPVYFVNATEADQIATAVRWATSRNIRVIAKGTGHDQFGRSNGANSLSIWTHNLKNLSYSPAWTAQGCDSSPQPAITIGSGSVWGDVVAYLQRFNKVAVGGADATVGMGGYLQGGGHGPLSSTHGMAADQILQATVVTASGHVVVANENQHADMLWAIRGGGPLVVGIAVEYVLKVYDAPRSVLTGGFTLTTTSSADEAVEDMYAAVSSILAQMPDLMDAGFTGTSYLVAGNTTSSANRTLSLSFGLVGYNVSPAHFSNTLTNITGSLASSFSRSIAIIPQETREYLDFLAFYTSALNAAPSTNAGGVPAVYSSRLLGRQHLDELPLGQLAANLKTIMTRADTTTGVICLQAGPGPRSVPASRRGALNPAWRSAYLHFIVTTAPAPDEKSKSAPPQEALRAMGEWVNAHIEPVWRAWAPDSGVYMNEANPFNVRWKEDFYGESYERLLHIKTKYDPEHGLYAWLTPASEGWVYDLGSGRLCKR